MMTLKTEERLISRLQKLSELELEAVLTELRDHIWKNKLGHVIENVFEGDRIDGLQHEYDELQGRFDDIETQYDDLRSYTQRAADLLESIDPDSDPDEIKKEIDKAIDLLT